MKKESPLLLDILIANGVNLDLLGQRQPDIYGKNNLSDLEHLLNKQKIVFDKILNCKTELTFFQSNFEGEFLEYLSKKKWHGIIINPGAWTHTSLALADRLNAINIPYIEVHLSNIYRREKIRHQSLISAGAKGIVSSMGLTSYEAGFYALLRLLTNDDFKD